MFDNELGYTWRGYERHVHDFLTAFFLESGTKDTVKDELTHEEAKRFQSGAGNVAKPLLGRPAVCWSDADHAGDEEMRRSTSCCHLHVGGHLVESSCKQQVIALSSGEGPFYALGHGSRDLPLTG